MNKTTAIALTFAALLLIVVAYPLFAPEPPTLEIDPFLFTPVVTPNPPKPAPKPLPPLPVPDIFPTPPIIPPGQSEPQTQPATTAASCPGGVCNQPQAGSGVQYRRFFGRRR